MSVFVYMDIALLATTKLTVKGICYLVQKCNTCSVRKKIK